MILNKVSVRNISQAVREINSFEWGEITGCQQNKS